MLATVPLVSAHQKILEHGGKGQKVMERGSQKERERVKVLSDQNSLPIQFGVSHSGNIDCYLYLCLCNCTAKK